VYPQTTIAASVGHAITPDTPTVTGVVTSYTVSPALPQGLYLNASSGSISGTPAVAAAQAAYTITAANAAGSTTATIQISVVLAPPSNLVYPQTTIAAYVDEKITPDVPTVTGVVTSYTVSPALPQGLSMNVSTGIIFGMPIATSAQTAYTVTAANAAGSTTATIQISVVLAPPSNLVYPQTTIVVTVGHPITADIPTVTSVVTSYSVSPALPPGLILNASSGEISGTPTATAAQTTYTVTAANAAGSTTATIQIAVVLGAPSKLVYPQTTITASVGQAIVPDIPTILSIGVVPTYSVSPALPPGLSLNASTGVIAGAPTATAAQASYTVTAGSTLGSTTATLQITVLQAQDNLLELGHASAIYGLRFEGGSVLSVDQSGHWALWNYSTGNILTSGDGASPIRTYGPPLPSPIDMAGQTAVVGITNGLEVLSASDGHLLSTISYAGLNVFSVPTASWWKLASDGSYVSIGSASGLYIYTTSGQLAAFHPGNYSLANAFAAPGQVLVALGAAGQNVIETISAADGTSTVSPVFSGQFNSWFLDGKRFLTNLSTTVWVYSDAGAEQAIVALPSVEQLTGQGDWIWTYQPQQQGSSSSDIGVNVYAIGSSTPSFSFSFPYTYLGFTTAVASGSSIALLPYASGQLGIVDLSTPTPSATNYKVPVAVLESFAASSASQWIVGNVHGALLDGASLATAPRFLGHGAAWSIAGTQGSAAVSTADGMISVFDPSQPTPNETINFASGKLAISADGSVLGASAEGLDYQFEPDRTLNFYSLPSRNVISSFPYTFYSNLNPTATGLVDFTLAASGTTIGQILNSNNNFFRQVTAITGGAVIWSDAGSNSPILISPDGTLIAVSGGPASPQSATNILKNGALVTAVPGFAVGWIDNTRLLVDHFIDYDPLGPAQYNGCTIYNSSGAALATPSLPMLNSIQTFNTDSVYDPTHNTIYSLTTGQATWTGSFPGSGVGAVSGPDIVYESGHNVVVETP
ncbi:MAG: putative Ig domain-containing protein, partial [Acidobacteriota bacterium]